MDRKAQRDHARTHVNPKLRRSLRLYFVISVVILLIVIIETVRNHASVWQVALGLLAGVIVGAIFARMYKISWDKDAMHVTNNIDAYGVVLLILYVAFDLSREHLVHIFTHNESVSAISLALLAGAMYGRVLGSGRVIIRLLRENKVFSRAHTH